MLVPFPGAPSTHSRTHAASRLPLSVVLDPSPLGQNPSPDIHRRTSSCGQCVRVLTEPVAPTAGPQIGRKRHCPEEAGGEERGQPVSRRNMTPHRPQPRPLCLFLGPQCDLSLLSPGRVASAAGQAPRPGLELPSRASPLGDGSQTSPGLCAGSASPPAGGWGRPTPTCYFEGITAKP